MSSGQVDQGPFAHRAGLHTEDGQLLHQSKDGITGNMGAAVWVHVPKR